jgi:hypothetical protein
MLAVTLLSSQAIAGPWARPAGSVYGKLGVARFSGEADFEEMAGRFTGDAAEAYAEVGLGRGVEVDAATRYVSHRVEDAASAGLQDVEVTVDWAPVSEREAFAVTAGARIAPYARGHEPELGPGGADLLFGAGWGRSLGPGWFAADALLRHRLGAPSSGVRFRAELGAQGSSPVGAAAGLEVQPAFGRTQSDDDVAPVPRVLALGAKAFGRLGAGVGIAADFAWLPPIVNDGPGWRVGAGLTFER